MGSLLSSAAGAKDTYSVGSPYQYDTLQGELSNQKQIYGEQQGLAQALQAQMAGQGPNPAQLQYQQNVQSNLANAQGLIASQRGLNPALAARMGANRAAAASQQSALQSAIMQQQQQLNATGELGGLYGQMQQGNLGQQQLYNQAQLGAEGINAGVSSQNARTNAGLFGGLMSAAGGAATMGMMGGAGGGGGGAGMMGNQAGGGGGLTYASEGGKINGVAKVDGDSQKNDTVPAMLSPGEIVIPRSHSHDPEKAKDFIDHLLKSEGKSKADYGDVLKARRKRKAS